MWLLINFVFCSIVLGNCRHTGRELQRNEFDLFENSESLEGKSVGLDNEIFMAGYKTYLSASDQHKQLSSTTKRNRRSRTKRQTKSKKRRSRTRRSRTRRTRRKTTTSVPTLQDEHEPINSISIFQNSTHLEIFSSSGNNTYVAVPTLSSLNLDPNIVSSSIQQFSPSSDDNSVSISISQNTSSSFGNVPIADFPSFPQFTSNFIYTNPFQFYEEETSISELENGNSTLEAPLNVLEIVSNKPNTSSSFILPIRNKLPIFTNQELEAFEVSNIENVTSFPEISSQNANSVVTDVVSISTQNLVSESDSSENKNENSPLSSTIIQDVLNSTQIHKLPNSTVTPNSVSTSVQSLEDSTIKSEISSSDITSSSLSFEDVDNSPETTSEFSTPVRNASTSPYLSKVSTGVSSQNLISAFETVTEVSESNKDKTFNDVSIIPNILDTARIQTSAVPENITIDQNTTMAESTKTSEHFTTNFPITSDTQTNLLTTLRDNPSMVETERTSEHLTITEIQEDSQTSIKIESPTEVETIRTSEFSTTADSLIFPNTEFLDTTQMVPEIQTDSQILIQTDNPTELDTTKEENPLTTTEMQEEFTTTMKVDNPTVVESKRPSDSLTTTDVQTDFPTTIKTENPTAEFESAEDLSSNTDTIALSVIQLSEDSSFTTDTVIPQIIQMSNTIAIIPGFQIASSNSSIPLNEEIHTIPIQPYQKETSMSSKTQSQNSFEIHPEIEIDDIETTTDDLDYENEEEYEEEENYTDDSENSETLQD